MRGRLALAGAESGWIQEQFLTVVDLVMAGILLAAALIGFKRGLLNMLGQLFLLLLPLAAAIMMLGPTSAWLTRLPFLAGLRDRLAEPVLTPLLDSVTTAQEAIETFLLPPLLAVWLKTRLPDPASNLGGVLPEMGTVLFQYVLTGLAFLILFIVISLAVRAAASLLTRFSDGLSVLGLANRLGGLVVGLLTGGVLLAVLLLLAAVAAPWLPGLASLIDQSTVAGYFYSVNFLTDFF